MGIDRRNARQSLTGRRVGRSPSSLRLSRRSILLGYLTTLRQVVQPVQVDADDHYGRPEQHRTDPQAILPAAHLGPCRIWRHASRFGGAAPRKIRKGVHQLPVPRKDYGSNRLFQSDLKEALEKDAAQALSAGFADCHPTRHELVGEGRMHSDPDNVPSLALTRSARIRPLRPSPRSAPAPTLHSTPTTSKQL